MHVLQTTLILFIISYSGAFAQISTKPKGATNSASPYEIVNVPETQAVIEESSLIFQSEAFANHQSQSIPGRRPIGENSLMTEMTEDIPNALRCYGFHLEPGITLRLRLKGKTEGRICMRFLPKAPADAMTAQVKRANMPPASLRKSRIEITNVTGKPYLVVLMLFGQPNYPYILEIERKTKE